jgi:hypothetical protein
MPMRHRLHAHTASAAPLLSWRLRRWAAYTLRASVRRRPTPWSLIRAGAWIMAVSTVVVLFTSAALHALPVFDDFCRGAFTPTTEFNPGHQIAGFGETLRWSYANWSGRWAGTALGMIVLGGWPMESAYPWILLLEVAVFVTASVIAAVRYFGRNGWIIAGCLWLTFWSSAPGFGEVFLWATTSLEALAGLVLAVLVWTAAEQQGTPRGGPLLAIGALIVGGVHELSGILFSGLVCWRAFYLWRSGRPVPRAIGMIAAFAVLGTAVGVIAPGNRVRSELYPDGGAFIESIGVAVPLAARSIRSWVLADLRLWAASLVVLALVVRQVQARRWKHQRTLRDAAWIAVAMTSVLAVGFWAPSFAIGAEMPLRTQAQLYLTFLTGWFLLVIVVGEWIASHETIGAPVLQGVQTVALVVLGLSVASDGNARLLRRDLTSGRLAEWHQAQASRMQMLREARGQGRSVTLPPVPGTGAFATVMNSPDPDYAHNLCLEWYYDVPRVATDTLTRTLVRWR